MAKRVADAQLTKDGAMSDDDGFSVGSQIGGQQRATAAQMAARRLAKPRGGRRPGAVNQRPSFNQSQLPSFQSDNTNNTSGTPSQQGGFNISNESQPNQISQSFPPFGSNSNTGFNTQFTAPSSTGFNFTAGQTASNNPFASIPTPDSNGFKGSIFNLPPQKETNMFQKSSEGEQKPLFASHSPFSNGSQGTPSLDQSQTVQNPFTAFTGQQQAPDASVSTLFSQTPSQQQTTKTVFGSLQQPSKSTSDLFASAKQPESQSISNPFGLSSSSSQQPGIMSKSNNVFGQSNTSQPSTSVDESSASADPEDHSMMSTTPDTSPASKLFGSPNAEKSQLPSSPTKDADSPAPAGSLFDRVSKPPAATSAEAATGQIGNTNTHKENNSIFDRASKPTDEAPAQPQAAQNSGAFFQMPQTSTTTNFFQAPSGESQHAKKKLFGNPFPSQTAQSSSASASPLFSPVKQLNSPQNDSSPNLSNNSSTTLSNGFLPSTGNAPTIKSKKRKFDSLAEAPEDFTEEEKIQLVTGYRLKALDMGMRKRLRTNMPEIELEKLKKFYTKKVQAIIAAKGGPLQGPAPGSKRKATEDSETSQDRGKKSRVETSSQMSPPPILNGTGPAGSQTSSLFRDILGGNSHPTTNGTGSAQPSFASPNKISSAPSTSPSKPNSTSSLFLPGASPMSSAPPQATSSATSPFKGFTPVTQSSQPFSSTANIFSAPQSAENSTSVTANKSLAAKPSMFNVGPISTSGSPNLFSTKTATEAESTSKANSAQTFKVPSFGGGKPVNFMTQFGDAYKKKSEEEDRDSDEDREEWQQRHDEEQRAKKEELEAYNKGKVPKMVNGKWEWVTTSQAEPPANGPGKQKQLGPPSSVFEQPQSALTNGHNIFGHLSGEESGAEGSKTGDADDEDDGHDDEEEEEALNDKVEADEQREGQKPIQAAVDNPFAVPSSKPASSPRATTTPSLFDRISRDGNGNPIREIPKEDTKISSTTLNIFGLGQSASNLGAASSSSGFSTSNLFNQDASGSSNPTTNKAPTAPDSSLFGNLTPSTTKTNIFGQPPSSTPVPDMAKNSDSQKGDNTWKPDTPIKFGAKSDAPSVNVTGPSPSKSPFSGLFGAAKPNTATDSPAKPLFNPFSTTPTKPPATGLGFGFTPTNPAPKSLAPPSNPISAATSRATSPGVTTGESANESAADHDEDHFPKEEQVDFTSGGPGEEDEDALFDVKGKALAYDNEKKNWITKGLGPFRVLKHRDTGNTRILMRQEPSGKIVVNSALIKGLTYEKMNEKAVRVPVVKDNGGIDNLTLRFGKGEDAETLVRILSENRPT